MKENIFFIFLVASPLLTTKSKYREISFQKFNIQIFLSSGTGVTKIKELFRPSDFI